MLEFLLVAPLPGGVEGAEHLSEQLGEFGGFLEIAAAAEDQRLLQPPVRMVMRCPRRCRSHGPHHGCSGWMKAGHDGADAFNQALILLSAGQAFLIKN